MRFPPLRDELVDAEPYGAPQLDVPICLNVNENPYPPSPRVIADIAASVAQAAASLMGMNTVYYRFRHMVGKPSYETKKALLRMQWMAKPKTPRVDFDLFSLACAALAGCQACIQSHEAAVLKGGLGEDHVHDAVRIAAVMQGFLVAISLS